MKPGQGVGGAVLGLGMDYSWVENPGEWEPERLQMTELGNRPGTRSLGTIFPGGGGRDCWSLSKARTSQAPRATTGGSFSEQVRGHLVSQSFPSSGEVKYNNVSGYC